tara:strand:+ start:508 stop:756 length:249 start_codon:yes stop_codon:yes gene_type:complete
MSKETKPAARPLSTIAAEIAATWPKVNFAAAPYLDAMASLNSINDTYMYESARTIVLYFLNNAKTYRGTDAKRIKAELRAML